MSEFDNDLVSAILGQTGLPKNTVHMILENATEVEVNEISGNPTLARDVLNRINQDKKADIEVE